jgi:hypothetical protein
VRAALDATFDALDTLRSRRASTQGNTNLTPAGKQDDLRKFLGNNTARILTKSKSTAAELRDALAGWKNRLAPPAPDKTDAAAAALRADIRATVRAMSPAQRVVFLSRKPDPTVAAALLEGPNVLSGMSDQERSELLDRYIGDIHAADLKRINQAEEALELLDAAVGVVWNTASAAGGFPSNGDFTAFVTKSIEG